MQNTSTNWDDLRLLLEVARHGSLLDAGRAMGLATTTVSRRLASLERSLGTHLLHRTYAGTQLTPDGQRLVAAMAPLAMELDSALRDTAGADSEFTGPIKLTVAEGLVPLVIDSIQRFRDLHPGVVFEIDGANRLLDMSKNEADIALRTVKPASEGLVVRSVGSLHFGVYESRQRFGAGRHGAPLPHLRRSDAVVLGGELSALPETVWLKQRTRNVALQAPTLASVRDAVRLGIGVGVLPDELVGRDPALHRLCDCDGVRNRSLWLIMNKRTARIARVRAFAEQVTRDLRAFAGL